jgi:3-oxoacyl-[acyl-carrier protein] reductase
MGSDHWIEQLEVNFLSAVRCSRSAVELLKGSPSPWIINIASIRGLTYATRSGVMAYSAAKAALISFTKSLAQELAPTVRVNAIAPGVTETPYLERVEPELVEKWRRDTLLGHLVLPDQVAEALIYLADAQSVTGEVLVVDGGTSSSSR